jgi:DNA-binding response OmpR family regulator
VSHILIVEDEQRIAAFLVKGLTKAGYRTTVTPTGEAALHLLRTTDVDVLILDIGLPGMDGLTVLHTLRAEGSALPVIILTANDTVASTVAGLEGGADDYVTKPFAFAELLARVRRRLAARAATRAVPAEGPDWLAVDGLGLDLRERRAHVAGAWVELSAREFDLLRALLSAPGAVLRREELLAQAWGVAHDPGTNVVDVYIGYLRRKLDPGRIETVRGQGYRLRPSPDRHPPGDGRARRP